METEKADEPTVTMGHIRSTNDEVRLAGGLALVACCIAGIALLVAVVK